VLVTLSLLVGVAWAGDPVVHAAGETDAVGVVAEATGRSPETLYAAPLGELMSGREPEGLGGVELLTCAGVPEGHGKLRQILDQAESHVSNQNKGATAALTQAEATLRCLREPLDTKLAARVFFLGGVVASRLGDRATALDRFHQALVFEVGLNWDPSFEPAVREVFDAAVELSLSAPQTATIRLLPHPGERSVWIDGRDLPPSRELATVAAGRHFVQIARPMEGGVVTGEVVLGREDGAVVLVPGAVTGEVLQWAGDEVRADDLAALLSVAVDPGQDLFVLTRGQVYAGVAGEGRFERIGGKDPANTGAALRASGAVALGVGAGAAVLGWLQGGAAATAAANADAGHDLDAFGAAGKRAVLWRAVTYAGAGVGGAGLVTLGVGLTPGFLSGGPGVHLPGGAALKVGGSLGGPPRGRGAARSVDVAGGDER
jgi:hypothetical protein